MIFLESHRLLNSVSGKRRDGRYFLVYWLQKIDPCAVPLSGSIEGIRGNKTSQEKIACCAQAIDIGTNAELFTVLLNRSIAGCKVRNGVGGGALFLHDAEHSQHRLASRPWDDEAGRLDGLMKNRRVRLMQIAHRTHDGGHDSHNLSECTTLLRLL